MLTAGTGGAKGVNTEVAHGEAHCVGGHCVGGKGNCVGGGGTRGRRGRSGDGREGQHRDRCEGGVSFVEGVVWRQANETVNACLGSTPPVGIVPEAERRRERETERGGEMKERNRKRGERKRENRKRGGEERKKQKDKKERENAREEERKGKRAKVKRVPLMATRSQGEQSINHRGEEETHNRARDRNPYKVVCP